MRIPDADWLRHAAAAQRLLRTHPEDAIAFVISRIPALAEKHQTDAHMRAAMKWEATRWHRTERKRGLKMSHTAALPSFFELDAPLSEDSPDGDTGHDVVPGHESPESWLDAVEQVTRLPDALAPWADVRMDVLGHAADRTGANTLRILLSPLDPEDETKLARELQRGRRKLARWWREGGFALC